MPKKETLFFLLLGLMMLGWVPTGSAFNHDIRASMLGDAVRFCPPALKAYLQQHRQTVQYGMSFADRWNRERIDPYELTEVYNALVNDLKGPRMNAYQTAKRFGVLACFAAETIFPGSLYSTGAYIPRTVRYPGYSKMPDLKMRVQYLVGRYRRSMGGKLDHRDIQHRYTAAVDEIVDLWIAAWKAGGQDVSGMIRTGASVRHENIAFRPVKKMP